jgi:hypothetical protein
MKLKRRPLKTIPWDRKAKELKQATQRWIDSGGDPELFKDVERLTREVRQLAQAATPTRKKVKSKQGLPGYLRDWLDEAKRRKPGSVKNPGGHQPPMHMKLLPGEADAMSKQALGFRSHQQRLSRTKTRIVKFSNGIATKLVTVIASTDREAEKKARKKARLTKMWKVVK